MTAPAVVVLPRALIERALAELAAYHDREWAAAFFGVDRHPIGRPPEKEAAAADCAACRLYREVEAALRASPTWADYLAGVLRDLVFEIENDAYNGALQRAKDLLAELGIAPQ